MGAHTDAEIEAWQQQTGIRPAEGEKKRILDAIAVEALKLVQTVTLEQSGIRDGAGYWVGSNAVWGHLDELTALNRMLGITLAHEPCPRCGERDHYICNERRATEAEIAEVPF